MSDTDRFLFHIPHGGANIFDIRELEKLEQARHPPRYIKVVDMKNHKTVGIFPLDTAIAKFR